MLKGYIELSLVDNNTITANISDITFFFSDAKKGNTTCIGITFFMFWVRETPDEIKSLINKNK